MKVLVVDDSKTMRMIIVKVLTEMGIVEVDEAPSADAAHYIVIRKRIDLILLDWNMPKVTGLEFLRILRSMPQTDSVPVIMVTTEGEREKVLQASMLGIDGFVIKPFRSEVLADKIREVCRKRGIPMPVPREPGSPAVSAPVPGPASAPPDGAPTAQSESPPLSDAAPPSDSPPPSAQA